jgi:hypothetical protein
MNNVLCPGIVMVMGLATTVFASANSSFSTQYVPATLKLDRRRTWAAKILQIDNCALNRI